MSEPTSTRRAIACLLLAATLAVLAGCARPQVTFVPKGSPKTLAQAEQAAQKVDISSASDVQTADADKARTEALVELRRKGPDAGSAADLLTRAFPLKPRSVPVYVESAPVDGQPAWIVVEAWGEQDGKLVHRRVWVFDRGTGDVLGSRSWL